MKSVTGRFQIRTEDKAVQVDLGFSLNGDSLLIDDKRNCFDERTTLLNQGDHVTYDVTTDISPVTYAHREARLLTLLEESKDEVRHLTEQQEFRDSELKRLCSDKKQLRSLLVECRGREKEMKSVINDLQMCLNDLQSKYEEQVAMSRLSDLERFEAIEKLQITLDRLNTENRQLKKLHQTLTVPSSHNNLVADHLFSSHPNLSTQSSSSSSASVSRQLT